MTIRLNKLGYQQLINEDIAWLEIIPRTLERDHIIEVLKASVQHEYPIEEIGRTIRLLSINEDDERIVDKMIADKTFVMKTQPLKGKE